MSPTATFGNSGPVFEGSPGTVSFSDAEEPSPVEMAAGLGYSLATTAGALADQYADAGSTASQTYTYSTAGDNTIYGRIFDADGGSTDYQTTLDVVRPDLENVQVGGSGVEEDVATLSGTIANPQNSPLYLSVNWGDGGSGTFEVAPGATSFHFTHYYGNYGTYNTVVTCAADPVPVASATATINAAIPGRERGTICVGGRRRTLYHVEADVNNLPDSNNLTYAWTVTEQEYPPTVVYTGTDPTADILLPDTSHLYSVAVTDDERRITRATPPNGVQQGSASVDDRQRGQHPRCRDSRPVRHAHRDDFRHRS